MTYDELINQITELNKLQHRDSNSLPHCSNLLFQLSKKNKNKIDYFSALVDKYITTRTVAFDPNDFSSYITSLTNHVNEYMDFLWPPTNNPFSAQADFYSSIVPEMLCTAFSEITRVNLLGLEVSAQKSLTIECTFDLINGGSVNFKNKRVDVAVVKPCNLKFNNSDYELPVPLIAIECKTNLDKNMISGIEQSVEDLKKTFPSCLYFVITELSDFDVQNNYASSEIDEMYILRKQKRAPVRKNPNVRNPLNAELFIEIIDKCICAMDDMKKTTTNLESRMKYGKLIVRKI